MHRSMLPSKQFEDRTECQACLLFSTYTGAISLIVLWLTIFKQAFFVSFLSMALLFYNVIKYFLKTTC